jgi:hypothetical protein
MTEAETLEALHHDAQRKAAEELAAAWGRAAAQARAPEKGKELELPTGLKEVLWIPLNDGFFDCWVRGFGHQARSTSRSKRKALAYALEELAKKLLAEAW